MARTSKRRVAFAKATRAADKELRQQRGSRTSAVEKRSVEDGAERDQKSNDAVSCSGIFCGAADSEFWVLDKAGLPETVDEALFCEVRSTYERQKARSKCEARASFSRWTLRDFQRVKREIEWGGRSALRLVLSTDCVLPFDAICFPLVSAVLLPCCPLLPSASSTFSSRLLFLPLSFQLISCFCTCRRR